jgi:lysophospholipase L1-like esterase
MKPIVFTVVVIALFLLALRAVLAETLPPSTTIVPGNPAILYVGRWDMSDPSIYHSYWGGAYLRVNFTGTSVSIKLAQGTSLVVSIDDETPYGVDANAGTTQLNVRPLNAGPHTLLVGSSGQNYEVLFQGLSFDQDAVVTSPAPKPIIEFIGDSITTFGGPDTSSIVNYAWNTAEALSCDHAQISFSGVALTSGYGCLPDKTGQDVQYLRLKNFNHLDSTAPWNFRYKPSIVVINLGQNDQCGAEPPATFSASLQRFIAKIRTQFPPAQIVVLRPFSGAFASAEQSTVATLTSEGDKKLLYVDTTGWLQPGDFRDGIHPNADGHLKVLSRLAPILRPLLPQ